MRRMFAMLLINVSLLSVAYAQATGKQQSDQTANKAEGSITVQGKTFKLNHVYAKLADGPNDKNRPAVTLLFSDKPVNRKHIDSSSKLTEKAQADGSVILTLNIEGGKLYSSQVLFNGDMLLGGGFSDDLYDFKPDTLNSVLARGAASTKKQVDWFGKKYEFKLSFNALLRKDEWTGAFYTPPPTGLAVDKATGKLVIDGKVTRLNFVYARAIYDFFDEKNNKVKITFTGSAVPQETLGKLFEIKKAGNPYVIEIEIGKGQDSGLDASIWPLDKLSSEFDPIVAQHIFRLETEIVKSDERAIEGRIYTLKPQEWSDRTYELDISFNASIKEGSNAPVTAKNGKPLPIDGGDPARMFLKYMKAYSEAKTLEELRQVDKEAHIARAAQEINPEDDPRFDTPEKKKEVREKIFELEKTFSVTDDLKITGGFIRDDRATLAFTGTQRGYEVLGRVNMHLENGQWKQGATIRQMGNKLARAKTPVAGKPPTRTGRARPAAPVAKAALATPNGTVLGTLTVNGKPIRLRYVYARRREASLPDRSGIIDLFITNQPVPEEIFAKIHADKYHYLYLTEDYFKDTSITGIYLCIDKGRSGREKVSYFCTLMTAEGYLNDAVEFTSFTMQGGAIRARAENKRDGEEAKYNYSFNVNANLGKLPGQAVGAQKAVASIRSTSPLPPEEGKVTGSLQLKGKTYNLKYAYAWRERIFFDEPDEYIHVLITEGPVAQDKKIFEDNFEMGRLIGEDKIRGIELLIDPSGVPLASHFLLQSGTLSDSTERTKIIEFKIENGRVRGKAEYRGEDGIRTYTVSFDARLKN